MNCLRLSGTKSQFLFLDALNHATLKWDNLSHSMTGTLMAQKKEKTTTMLITEVFWFQYSTTLH